MMTFLTSVCVVCRYQMSLHFPLPVSPAAGAGSEERRNLLDQYIFLTQVRHMLRNGLVQMGDWGEGDTSDQLFLTCSEVFLTQSH
jgi:hypothetical protein